jgi:GntR family transcriptional regulator
VARALALRTGDAVLQVRRVLSFAGVPTILEDIWLPGGPFKGLTAERLAGYHGPMYACSRPNSACAWCAPRKKSGPSADAAQAQLLKGHPQTPC